MSAGLEPVVPGFRVVNGSPTDEEVAALAVVLAVLSAGSSMAAAPDSGPGAVQRPWRRRRSWTLQPAADEDAGRHRMVPPVIHRDRVTTRVLGGLPLHPLSGAGAVGCGGAVS